MFSTVLFVLPLASVLQLTRGPIVSASRDVSEKILDVAAGGHFVKTQLSTKEASHTVLSDIHKHHGDDFDEISRLRELAAQKDRGQYLLPAFVINLAKRPDRWQRMQERLERVPFLQNFERIAALDGSNIDTSMVTTSWSTASNWQYIGRRSKDCGYTVHRQNLTNGERGCSASHINVWRRCADGYGPTVVLEDDAVLKPDFTSRVRNALTDLGDEQPDILYLSYIQGAPWRRTVSADVREAEYLWTTTGYVLWPSGARKLLAALPVNQPVDNFMATLMSKRKLRGFAVTPGVVHPDKSWDVSSDVAHSDSAAWVDNCHE